MGRKKRPFYRLVVLDSRKRRDGAYLANLGFYNPFTDPHEVQLHTDDIISWLGKGATVSETARSLLKAEGVLYRYSLVKQGLETTDIEQRMTEWIDTAAARKRGAADAAAAKREDARVARVKREEEAKAKAAEAAAAEAAGEKAAATEEAAEETAEEAAAETPVEAAPEAAAEEAAPAEAADDAKKTTSEDGAS
jgi:small subunit ribosomal protein S16